MRDRTKGAKDERGVRWTGGRGADAGGDGHGGDDGRIAIGVLPADTDRRVAESLRRPDGDGRRLSSIAVAIDFSAPSASAFEWAVRLAAPAGAEVVAIHAIEPTPLGVGREIESMLVRAGTGRLEAFVARAAARGVAVLCVCRAGRAPMVVCEEAARRGVDLVVAGDRGLSAVRRAMVGSVADRILRLAPMPVLVARAGQAPGDGLSVVAAVDFSPASREALDAVCRLAAVTGLPLRLHLVHAVMAPPVLSEPDAPAAIRPNWLAVETGATRRLEALRAVLAASGIETTAAVERGDASVALADAARELHADLVVAGRGDATGIERLLLGSTAERILHRAPCAVLAVRRAPAPATRRTRKDPRGARGAATA